MTLYYGYMLYELLNTSNEAINRPNKLKFEKKNCLIHGVRFDNRIKPKTKIIEPKIMAMKMGYKTKEAS